MLSGGSAARVAGAAASGCSKSTIGRHVVRRTTSRCSSFSCHTSIRRHAEGTSRSSLPLSPLRSRRVEWRSVHMTTQDRVGRYIGTRDFSASGSSGGSTPAASAAVSSTSDDEVDFVNRNTVAKPANLFIDPRSTCSPFHGLRRTEEDLKVHKNNRRDRNNESNLHDKMGDTKQKDQEEELDNDDDSESLQDDGGEEEYYDLSTLPEPAFAIPLPDRLHVSVQQFASRITDDQDHDDADGGVGTFILDASVFGCDPVRVDLIHRVVIYQRNKKRGKRYPARTKTIGEVSGSGRKVRPQKGQGRARAGHSRPPHWRKGAKAHGPKGVAQDYTTKLNKKVRKLGLCHALSQKLYEGNLIVVDQIALPSHKTKHLSNVLWERFGIGGRSGASALIVDDATNALAKAIRSSEGSEDGDEEEALDLNVMLNVDANLLVASKNIHNVKVMSQHFANVYDILKYEKLVLSLPAIRGLEERLRG